MIKKPLGESKYIAGVKLTTWVLYISSLIGILFSIAGIIFFMSGGKSFGFLMEKSSSEVTKQIPEIREAYQDKAQEVNIHNDCLKYFPGTEIQKVELERFINRFAQGGCYLYDPKTFPGQYDVELYSFSGRLFGKSIEYIEPSKLFDGFIYETFSIDEPRNNKNESCLLLSYDYINSVAYYRAGCIINPPVMKDIDTAVADAISKGYKYFTICGASGFYFCDYPNLKADIAVGQKISGINTIDEKLIDPNGTEYFSRNDFYEALFNQEKFPRDKYCLIKNTHYWGGHIIFLECKIIDTTSDIPDSIDFTTIPNSP